ncbi:CD164 sialomucin-like 2 protein [Salarias fasciatus]|uniref:CD164 sialomucin-like 2 protein n=1 Tax=Salarias fasciatus TaxID=181472 RepID=UPI00117691EB|nr:CD164 sialomucin-like 2 protein [Salarias fasciatus]
MQQLLALKVLGTTLVLLMVVPLVYSQSDCSQAQSCDMCVGDSVLNLTGCVWRLCPDGNDTSMCVADQGDAADSGMACSWTKVSELCSVVETVAVEGRESESGDGGNSNSSPQLSQAKFDMSSFIGGIILVLCVQAGGFFAMRFLKSKEQSNYDPIEQPQ